MYEHDEAGVYHAYIPEGMKEKMCFFACFPGEFLLNGEMLKSGDEITGVTEGEPYCLQVLDWKKDVAAECEVVFYYIDSLPLVFINTESGDMEYVDLDKMNEEQAQYVVCTQNGQIDSAGSCMVKGRGNTSWNKKQKPYNIDLEEPEMILGMDKTDEWALLNNWGEDVPQLKNKIAYDVAGLMKLSYTPQCEFVNLYLNGKYNGLYLLSQRINAEDKVLLEFDSRYEEEPNHFATENQTMAIKEPQDITEKRLLELREFVQEAEGAIYSESGRNEKTQKMYSEYIDIESWAKIYQLQNFFVQWDVEFSSFYVYMSEKQPVLYAGPIWDFDLTCGRIYYGNYPQLTKHLLWLDTQGKWLKQLGKHEEFSEYSRKEFEESLLPVLEEYLSGEYWDVVESIDKSVYVDAVRWSKELDFDKHSEDLWNWMTDRHVFLSEYYLNPGGYCKVGFTFPWGSVYYHIEEGETLDFLPLNVYGEMNIYLESMGYSDILGWVDENGNEVFAGEVINDNVNYYPILEEYFTPEI